MHRFWNFSWFIEEVSYYSNKYKNDRRIINNYFPVSLLQICGKIFERIIYNPVFLYLENNELLTPHQCSFCPNDTCIYQQISIVRNIYADFDHNPSVEVRFNFFDISRAIDKVWHKGLLYKLESLGISRNLLNFVVFLMIDVKE